MNTRFDTPEYEAQFRERDSMYMQRFADLRKAGDKSIDAISARIELLREVAEFLFEAVDHATPEMRIALQEQIVMIQGALETAADALAARMFAVVEAQGLGNASTMIH
jgi:hypothetical protein